MNGPLFTAIMLSLGVAALARAGGAQAPDATGVCVANCGSDSSASSSPSYDFTPTYEDPAEAARREEAARLAAEQAAAEEQAARDLYEASVAKTTARAVRGRDLAAAAAAFQAALAQAPGRPVPKELLAPLPKRARLRLSPLDQAGCAAFHSGLALSMGVWHHTGLPSVDPMFLDVERIAHEASTVFDRGESVDGCQRASVALPSAPPSVAAGGTRTVEAVVPDLHVAARALEAAERKAALAAAAYEKAKSERVTADSGRVAELERLDRERSDRDGALRKSEADRKLADAEAARAKPLSRIKAKEYEEALSKQKHLLELEEAARKAKQVADEAHAQLAAKVKADAKAAEDREREADRLARETLAAEENARNQLRAREAEARASVAALDERSKPRPRPASIHRATPRPTRRIGVR